MADDFYYSDPGSGSVFAAPEIGGKKYQAFLLSDPTTPSQRAGVNASGQVKTYDERDLERITATTTVTAGAYTDGDQIGGSLDFPNAVRASGGAGVIHRVHALFRSNAALTGIQVVFFDRAYTPAGDNNAWNPSDADMSNYLGSIYLGDLINTDVAAVWTNNQVVAPGLANVPPAGKIEIPYVLAGTTLYAAAVVDGTPSPAATTEFDLVVVVERF